MTWVLIVITVFTTSTGVATDTAFREFGTRAACERAAAGIENELDEMLGTIGRDVVANCYPSR